MKSEVLLAVISKKIDERLDEVSQYSFRGLRGHRGQRGEDGKGFILSEHEEVLKEWAREFSIKFEDFSEEQIEKLRGPRGFDGRPGPKGMDGKDFSLEEHEEQFKNWAKEFSIKFSDFTSEEIEKLRGPKGQDGRDGEGFDLEKHGEFVTQIIEKSIEGMYDRLRLKFEDLRESDIEQIRGPRGRDGRDGRDFIFEEHREFFLSLKPKFSNFTEEEKNSLRLRFSQLTEEEKEELKLRFEDLSDEDRSKIRGFRGQRGKPGRDGIDGINGKDGKDGISIRGLPGVPGISGRPGIDGRDGRDGEDGQDAPFITDIKVDQTIDKFWFVFEFSDGTRIETDRIKIPRPNVYVPSPGAAVHKTTTVGGGGDTESLLFFEKVSSTVSYAAWGEPGTLASESGVRIKRITKTGGGNALGEWADGDSVTLDKIWDDRLTYIYS